MFDIYEDENTFYYLQNLSEKNFSKKIGQKNKIIIFKSDNEETQRRYFLKLVTKIFKRKNKNSDEELLKKILNSYDKSIKLNLIKPNQLQKQITFEIFTNKDNILIFKSDTKCRLLMTYIKNSFKDHLVRYRLKNETLTIFPNSLETLSLLDELIEKKEILGWYVKFKINKDEISKLREYYKKKEARKRSYRLVYGFLREYYALLECKEHDPFEKVRQNYLQLVKKYHPDRVCGQSSIVVSAYTEKFQQIQNAYKTIKDFYKECAAA
jgi:molecular chaperone DnaJ